MMANSVMNHKDECVDDDTKMLNEWISQREMSSTSQHEREIIEADRQGMDPDTVEHLLSTEMFQLPMKERNDIHEEIHGVRCLAPDETPEFLERSLRDLATEIDEKIPDGHKQAYIQSHYEPNEKPEHKRLLTELQEAKPSSQISYVNTNEFRLRFLRCELFDIRKAARRLVRYLDLLLHLFGDFALRRPLCLSDFSKEELRFMRMGRFHVLPRRDRSGRRIGVLFPPQQGKVMPPKTKAKIILYISWAAGYNDVTTQRKGLVILIWYDRNFRYNSRPEGTEYDFFSLISTRLISIHCCSPDTPYYRLRRSIIKMRAGSDHRPKLRFHLGESVEIQYVLQSYGIRATDIPVSWTGKIKTKNLVNWMQSRYVIEDGIADSTSSQVTRINVVECPQLDDILFRKGNSNLSHPGNAAFRTFIESRALHTLTKDTGSEKSKNNIKRPKPLASDIFEERHAQGNPGRYLVWDSERDWWYELTDRDQICSKIEYMIREIQKPINELRRNQRKEMQKRQKRNSVVHLKGGTAVFQVQDNWVGNSIFLGNASKRPRLFESYDTSSDTDGSGNTQCDGECFGMKFSPCFM